MRAARPTARGRDLDKRKRAQGASLATLNTHTHALSAVSLSALLATIPINTHAPYTHVSMDLQAHTYFCFNAAKLLRHKLSGALVAAKYIERGAKVCGDVRICSSVTEGNKK